MFFICFSAQSPYETLFREPSHDSLVEGISQGAFGRVHSMYLPARKGVEVGVADTKGGQGHSRIVGTKSPPPNPSPQHPPRYPPPPHPALLIEGWDSEEEESGGPHVGKMAT